MCTSFVLLAMTLGFSTANAQSVLVESADGHSLKETDPSGKMSQIKEGTLGSAGNTLATGPRQSARLIYEDGTELVLSENSAVTLEPRSEDGQLSTKLENGVVKAQVVPSKSKIKNFRFLVKTKGVVLGVRGTEFWVQYDRKSDDVRVNTLEGMVVAAKSPADLQKGAGVPLGRDLAFHAQRGGFGAPQPFDRVGFSKEMQARHPQMNQMIIQSQNRPVQDLPGFQGARIRNEQISHDEKEKGTRKDGPPQESKDQSGEKRPQGEGQSQGGMNPQSGMSPQGMSPQGMSPQGMSPQGMSPQGMSPQGMSPQGMSPQGMSPQGMSPQGMSPQGMSPQKSGGPQGGPAQSMGGGPGPRGPGGPGGGPPAGSGGPGAAGGSSGGPSGGPAKSGAPPPPPPPPPAGQAPKK